MKTAVREVTTTQTTKVTAKTRHPHHWLLESPHGEFSRGTCKVCGKVKKFPNSAEDNLWSRNVPQSRWTGRSDGESAGY